MRYTVWVVLSAFALVGQSYAFELGEGDTVFIPSVGEQGSEQVFLAGDTAKAAAVEASAAKGEEIPLLSFDLGGNIGVALPMFPVGSLHAGVSLGDRIVSAGLEAGATLIGGSYHYGAYVRLMPYRITEKGTLYVVGRVGRFNMPIDNYGNYDSYGGGIGWFNDGNSEMPQFIELSFLKTECGSSEKRYLCDPMTFIMATVGAEGRWIPLKWKKGAHK